MSLSSGSRLGHYEVLDPLGAGGMGEVYRAQDKKLGREVAIKILPEQFSQNTDRLSRFEREARLLASLNHPNIATLHGMEEEESPQPERSAERSGVAEREAVGVGPRGTDQRLHFLVMELVPGETLAERLARGPLELEEAMPLFKQIAEALAAAHQNGVIHRDLKPANIKITPEGEIKVLDFGLAKALDEDGDSQELSESPTANYSATRDGVILGTAPYMSPEQARGKRVDKETDIWAFGCVLFEALTGTKAFFGESVTDTLASVVRSEPAWDRLPGNTPWRVRDLIKRCLRKDPKRRLKDMGDAALDIEDAVLDDTTPQPKVGARRSRHTVAIAIAAAALGGLAVWSFSSLGSSTPVPSAGVKRFVASAGIDSLRGFGSRALAISPESDYMVFVAPHENVRRLYLRRLDAFEGRPIPGTENAILPFFSPAGDWIGFSADGELKKVALSGGAPMTICRCRSSSADWTVDDRIVFASAGRLYEVPSSGGEPRPLSPGEDETGFWHQQPQALPGSDAILFTAYRSDTEEASIAVHSRSSGESRVLIEDGTSPSYVSTGHLVYFAAGTLHAVPFDTETHEIRGTPIPVVEGVNAATGFSQISSIALYDVSREGTLVYSATGEVTDRQLFWVDRSGAREPVSEKLRAYQRPRLSRDGRRLAVTVEHTDRARDLWILELERDTLTRFTFDPAHDIAGMWSPDGKTIAFASTRSGAIDLFAKRSDGTGRIVPLLESDIVEATASWTPDGARLVYQHSSDNQITWDIGFVDLEEGGKVEAFIESPFSERHPSVSPDGRFLVYVSDESGRDEVFVRPFPSGEGKWQVSSDGGTEPVWARSGREIFYRGRSAMMSVSVSDGVAFESDSPSPLFEDNYRRDHANHLPNYDVAPDGRFLMMQTGEANTFHVVLNWGEELKRLVPTK